MPTLYCQHCGTALSRDEPIGRDWECEGCRHDLRACRNCRHYDERYNNSCTETMADPVEDKTRRNFCEYFFFTRAAFTPVAASDRAANARAKLGALFNEAPSDATRTPKPGGLFGGATPASRADREADAKAKLDALFKKSPPGDTSKGG